MAILVFFYTISYNSAAAFKRKIHNFFKGSCLFPVIFTIELEYFVLQLNQLNDF